MYLLYAHLKPDTVAVHVGQRVNVADELGLIATTGNSTTSTSGIVCYCPGCCIRGGDSPAFRSAWSDTGQPA